MTAPRRFFSALLLCVLAVAAFPAFPAGAQTAPAQVRESGYVEVRDGTLLHYTVVRPAGKGPFPTLFEYSGYDPGMNPDQPYIDRFVPKGYAYIGVNLRGSGCSGGVWDFFQPKEATDGYDVVEWIADQQWSNGKVAMVGKSYPGITQLFVAEQRPPHLVAIAPGHPYGDIYRDVAYPGGIFNYAFAGLWSFFAQPFYSYGAAFEGSSAGDQVCMEHQQNRVESQRYNPFLQAQEHPWDDALIRERSPLYNLKKIDVPVWTVMAWQDEQVGPRAVNMLSKLDVPFHAIVTNGDHGMYRTEPALDELERFFDYYVKGAKNGFGKTPRVRVWWEAGRNGSRAPGWVTEHSRWPVPTKAKRLFLSTEGKLRAKVGEGGPDPYAYVGPTGQGIQNARYSGVTTQPDRYLWDVKSAPGTSVAYTSAPLEKDTSVLGSGSLDLWLASTAVDTDLQVTLTEVRPDGQEVYVQSGWLRASHRALDKKNSTVTRPYQTHQEADSELLTPGEAAKMRIEIFPFGHMFRKGSQIRVYVEGPKFLPELWGFTSLPVPAANLVYHDADHPSSLALPVLDGRKAPVPLPDCGTVIRQPCRPA
jgi:putative CocE/NonD family hydrolase